MTIEKVPRRKEEREGFEKGESTVEAAKKRKYKGKLERGETVS
ncbi:hypothetical protein [Enterococcus faecium]|nr:hypothetical protein [Enterococcus faecium]